MMGFMLTYLLGMALLNLITSDNSAAYSYSSTQVLYWYSGDVH